MEQIVGFIKRRAMMVVLVVFVIAWFQSCTELKYSLRSKTADAQVTGIREIMEGSHVNYRYVDYQFKDSDGTVRSEFDRIPAEAGAPEVRQQISVQYLPGVEDASRLEGHSNKLWVYTFLTCLAAMGFLGYRTWHAN